MQLHLNQPATIIKEGKEIILDRPLYNITDEKLIKENGFFKCHKCKDYFDQAMEYGKFHPLFTANEGREFCEAHFKHN